MAASTWSIYSSIHFIFHSVCVTQSHWIWTASLPRLYHCITASLQRPVSLHTCSQSFFIFFAKLATCKIQIKSQLLPTSSLGLVFGNFSLRMIKKSFALRLFQYLRRKDMDESLFIQVSSQQTEHITHQAWEKLHKMKEDKASYLLWHTSEASEWQTSGMKTFSINPHHQK